MGAEAKDAWCAWLDEAACARASTCILEQTLPSLQTKEATKCQGESCWRLLSRVVAGGLLRLMQRSFFAHRFALRLKGLVGLALRLQSRIMGLALRLQLGGGDLRFGCSPD